MFKGITKKPLHDLWKAAHAAGAAGTHIADVAVFGTRYTPKRNAGTAGHRVAAAGAIGVHSVWEGPKQIRGGAPILRRARLA